MCWSITNRYLKMLKKIFGHREIRISVHATFFFFIRIRKVKSIKPRHFTKLKITIVKIIEAIVKQTLEKNRIKFYLTTARM